MLLFLALQMAGMDHKAHIQAETRIEVNDKAGTQVEVPVEPNHMTITSEMLAPATIAFCERTGRTYCTNEVSAQSGGGKVTVCKVSGQWIVNRCRKPK